MQRKYMQKGDYLLASKEEYPNKHRILIVQITYDTDDIFEYNRYYNNYNNKIDFYKKIILIEENLTYNREYERYENATLFEGNEIRFIDDIFKFNWFKIVLTAPMFDNKSIDLRRELTDAEIIILKLKYDFEK